MRNLTPYFDRLNDHLSRLPFSPQPAIAGLHRQLPTVRIFDDPDMLDAVHSTRDNAIDAFWGRFDAARLKMGARHAERLWPQIHIVHALVTYPMCVGYGITAALYTGFRATWQAASLARSGQPEAARARIKEHAFEVYCALRATENLILIAVSFGLLGATFSADRALRRLARAS